jgi:hypothetical protein
MNDKTEESKIDKFSDLVGEIKNVPAEGLNNIRLLCDSTSQVLLSDDEENRKRAGFVLGVLAKLIEDRMKKEGIPVETFP